MAPRIRGGSVGTLTRPRIGRSEIQIREWASDFSLPQSVEICSGAHPESYPISIARSEPDGTR